jgi:hypothetical protein
MATYARHKDPHSCRCWSCGEPFTAIRSTAFLCSPKCRQAWRRALAKATEAGKRNPAESIRHDSSRIQVAPIPPQAKKKTRKASVPSTYDVNALIIALQENPDDQTIQLVLCDAIQDTGLERAKAENLVDLIAAEIVVRRTMSDPLQASRWRNQIRRLCRAPKKSAVPVEIVSGDLADQPPTLTGSAPYYTFRGTDVVCHTSVSGPEVEYHASRQRITVGTRWVRSTLDTYVIPRRESRGPDPDAIVLERYGLPVGIIHGSEDVSTTSK